MARFRDSELQELRPTFPRLNEVIEYGSRVRRQHQWSLIEQRPGRDRQRQARLIVDWESWSWPNLCRPKTAGADLPDHITDKLAAGGVVLRVELGGQELRVAIDLGRISLEPSFDELQDLGKMFHMELRMNMELLS
ncbi:MAG: hypothetical protein FIB00_16760 [Chloroflexi bacterium]|nr:hypothetical protein [Chloroflexota bacterium]PWB43380.1 MAG: hypothetical protein C3F10_11890 [Dehalococcoidia bacterium]